MYIQCKLKKGNVTTISWIPQKYAIKGQYVKLKDNKQWTDGWLIEEVWGNKEDDMIIIDRDAYKYQRGMSDI